MKHPCSNCPAKYQQGSGRIFCPQLNRELALEGCNRMHSKKPKAAWAYIKERIS